MIAAIFQLDGTLYDGHIWLALKRHHETHRVRRLALYTYMLTHVALWPLYRLGLLSEAQFYKMWARHMPWLIRGMTLGEADRVFEWVTEEDVVPNLRDDIVSVMRDHRDRGHAVVLLSGTFQPLLRVIGRRLGVAGVVGTRLAVQDGRYTGRIVPPVCMAQGKAERLQAFLNAADEEIDLSASYANADSPLDLPALELVGHPVAVHADHRLAAIAADRGWAILGEPGNA